MSSKTIYYEIYNKLTKLIPNIENLEIGYCEISKAKAFMDLHLEVLSEEEHNQETIKIISLAHYCMSNGDLVSDPDIEIKIYTQHKMAEALMYRDFLTYQVVYPKPNAVYPKFRTDLNSFLNRWLDGHLLKGYQFNGGN